MPYDAVIVVSFGGPESDPDVIPFLQNVLRGRDVAAERLEEVAAHYRLFGGRSPINDQNRDMVDALRTELATHGPDLPVYWGNRNWGPYLADTVRAMRDDGVSQALAFVTSAYASYSGCRQYLGDVDQARIEVGPGAPRIDKLRAFYNHPGFIEANVDALRIALSELPDDAHVAFCAHSIPLAMADSSDYVAQLNETARLVAEQAAPGRSWSLVYQSRSGRPGQPWLEPDICDHLRDLAGQKVTAVAAAPIGFVSDHMEVVYDLDTEAAKVAADLGLGWARAATAFPSAPFVTMIRQLIQERTDASAPKLALGAAGPYHDVCNSRCCPAPQRPPAPSR